ncbi:MULTISPECIES: GntR family transcriptional regulator [Streptomyces]|uniref:GntR family transcriptional regulator n=2 Tax=Streptomyces TaxID=1883 RepID=A0A2U9NZ16_STRAS|nr:GntR family transcriptional regulator [Streptomyces actuosus]AWT42586.1 GntR family transcriptional regulator [Streptomyces actuosus]MBM4819797.1 GntR family transcriptional regulator [Streptomyces actuosus]
MADENGEESVWPVQDQIASYLRDGILNGDFPAGEKLPSSRELHARFGAAAQTIRNAIAILEKEGLAYTRRGAGVYARQHRQRTMAPASYKNPPTDGGKYQWITAAEQKGLSGKSELLAVEEVAPPAAIREALDLAMDEKALLRRQVLYLDDQPCELVEVYFPLSLVQGTPIADHRKIRGGAGRVLLEAGYPPLRCVDKVAARWPTPEQAKALQMPTKLPVLRQFRVTYSVNDRPIQAEIMAKAGHFYELQYEF